MLLCNCVRVVWYQHLQSCKLPHESFHPHWPAIWYIDCTDFTPLACDVIHRLCCLQNHKTEARGFHGEVHLIANVSFLIYFIFMWGTQHTILIYACMIRVWNERMITGVKAFDCFLGIQYYSGKIGIFQVWQKLWTEDCGGTATGKKWIEKEY